MGYDLSQTTEDFKDGIRVNSLILDGNKYYNNHPPYGSGSGISTCIDGMPMRSGANVLANCVGSAWGAYNETWAKLDKNHTGFRRVNGNGNQILENALKDDFFKDYVLPVTATPPKGGLIIWKDVHVAYIADVDGNDTITIVQSGYDENNTFSGWTKRNSANTGWVCDSRTITRNQGGTNLWYYHADRANKGCLGFLANPGVVNNTEPPVEVTKYGVHIGGKFYSAHIYNGTKWVKATPKIYNGTKWVNCSE